MQGGGNIKVRKTFTHKALLSFITQPRPPPVLAKQNGRRKKKRCCSIKTFIKVVNFGTINNNSQRKASASANSNRGHQNAGCHGSTQSRCDLAFSIEIADD